MPSVFVGQDCKYDRNFEALPVKEYLTQVLAKSYGAPEGSCEIHLYINTFPRNNIAFSRNIIPFSRNTYIAFLCNSFAFSRNTIAFS